MPPPGLGRGTPKRPRRGAVGPFFTMFGAMIGDDLASPGILDTFEFMATEPSSARSTQQLSVEMQPQRENSTSSLGGFFLESGTVDQPSNSLESVVGAGTGGSLLLHGGRKRRRASDDFGHSRIIESDQCSDHDDRHLKAPNHPPHTSQEATIESLKREVAELLSARTLVGLGCYTAPLAPGPQAALAHARRQAARAFLHYRCASVMQPQWWKVRRNWTATFLEIFRIPLFYATILDPVFVCQDVVRIFYHL